MDHNTQSNNIDSHFQKPSSGAVGGQAGDKVLIFTSPTTVREMKSS